MFGIGMPEMILILAVALIVIGPKKLPDLAKSLGKAMGEFKKATSDLKESMQIDSELKDLKSTFDDLEKEDPKPLKKAHGNAERQTKQADDPLAATGEQTQSDEEKDPLESVKTAFNSMDKEDAKATADGPVAEGDKVDLDPAVDGEPERPKDV
jgi:TatA/E family protein of Tat protein translocase